MFPNVPLSDPFESFAREVVKQMSKRGRFYTAENIAHEFRMSFHVPVPVTDRYVNSLVEETIGVELIGEPMEGVEAFCRFNAQSNRYEIITAYQAKEYTTAVLHDLFEILYGRCFNISPITAELWLADQKVLQPHCLADRFAYNVLVPPVKFREAAKLWGYDPFTLADRFSVRPGIIVQAISKHGILPCPMFILRLGTVAGDDNDLDLFDECDITGQLSMLVPTSEGRWKVWKSLFKKERKEKHPYYAIRQIRDCAPKQGKLYAPTGMIAEALKTEQCLSAVTNSLFGRELLEPVFMVVRPGGKNKKNCFVQVVPQKFKSVLIAETPKVTKVNGWSQPVALRTVQSAM